MKTAWFSKNIACGLLTLSLVTVLSAIALTSASAQSDVASYPKESIRIVVPYPPGGGADFLARLLAEKAQAKWGQTVIVENRSGAGGNIGTEFVSRAAPDGYTLLFSAQAPLVINKSLYGKLNFDPDNLAPIAVMVTAFSVLLVNPKVPANNLKEFIAYARANPDKVNMSTTGNGGSTHLGGAWLHNMINTRATFVHYKGAGPAAIDLVAGRVNATPLALQTSLQLIKTGKVRALAMMGSRRADPLPGLPTIGESVPGYAFESYIGISGPAGVPEGVVRQLSEGFARVVRMPEVVKALEAQGSVPVGSTPAEFTKLLQTESERWRKVVRENNIKLED